jgi:hypothetical protein
MKMTKTIVCALAAAIALLAGKAVAASTPVFPVLTVSGTFDLVKTTLTAKSGNSIQTSEKVTFNNNTIVGIISNALVFWPPAGTNAIHIPAKSYIDFNPYLSDISGQSGIFYVTNKNGFSLPLSGVDTNGYYYSYAELDTDAGGNNNILGFDLGLGNNPGYDDFNAVDTFNLTTNNSGTFDTSSTAVFYVHDNPYAYDAADSWAWNDGFGPSAPALSSPNPSGTAGPNYENSVEMQGILNITTSTAKDITKGSGTFTGSGNALVNGKEALITAGKVTVTSVVTPSNP